MLLESGGKMTCKISTVWEHHNKQESGKKANVLSVALLQDSLRASLPAPEHSRSKGREIML